MLKEYLSTLANKLRSVLETTEKINAQNFVDKIQDVYSKGQSYGYDIGYMTGAQAAYPQGKQDGYEQGITEGIEQGKQEGIEEGKQAEYDKFWDNFQNYGNRTEYKESYQHEGWNDVTFRPKYDMNLTGARYMFSYDKITNLKQILIDCGVTINFSKVSDLYYFAFDCKSLTHLPEIGSSKVINLQYSFYKNLNLESIDKVIISNDGKCTFNQTFHTCSKLQNVIFEGVIGQNGLDIQWSSKLNKESIRSIINCLSTTTSGLSITLSLTAVKKAFETSSGANDGNTSEEWLNLTSTKTNWAINLI